MGGALSSQYRLKKLVKKEKSRILKAKLQEAEDYIQSIYQEQLRNGRIQNAIETLEDPSSWRYEQQFCSRREELEAEREESLWSDLLQVRLLERNQSDWWDKMRQELTSSIWK